ncbi:MAG: ABC transporter ATP-binding protein [Planctomycetota bacterium]
MSDSDPTTLRAAGLSKTYGRGSGAVEALRDVSLTLGAGRSLVLLGRSGSGKSTLLNLLGAMDTPSSGAIEVEGRDLAGLSPGEQTLFRRRRLGFVFQSFHLIPSLDVLHNAAVPWMLDGAFDAGARESLAGLLGRLGLAGKLDRYPDELSGGQRQRVAIARALARSPALVLADEPTGNLDKRTGEQILDVLDELRRERRFAMVLATHDDAAAARCDERLVLEDGAAIENSTLVRAAGAAVA